MNIFRNRFLNTASFLLAPPDMPNENEDTRSEAQKQRDAIEISDSTDEKNNKEGSSSSDENKEDEEENDEDEEENDDENEDDDEENKNEDENKKEDEDKEETDEEKTARLTQEKEDRRQARQQRKWDKLAAEKTAAEKRVQELEARLKEQPVEGLTEEEVQRRADALAATKLAEKQAAEAKKKFEDTCDSLESVAIKTDKDFSKKIVEVTSELGPIPAPIIEVLGDLEHGNGGQVLAYLADNIDEAEDLYDLRDNPRKLDRALSKISDKLKEAEKKPKRERSALPPPIEPVGNSRQESTRITGKETQEEFNAKRAKQIKERQAQRGY